MVEEHRRGEGESGYSETLESVCFSTRLHIAKIAVSGI